MVKELLEGEEGTLFQAATAKIAELWPQVMREKSGWTNAKQQLAVKLQQNLEVRVVPEC